MTIFCPCTLFALREGGTVPIPSPQLPCACPSGTNWPLTPSTRIHPYLAIDISRLHTACKIKEPPGFLVFRVLTDGASAASQNISCHSPSGPSLWTFHSLCTACALCGAWTPVSYLVGSAPKTRLNNISSAPGLPLLWENLSLTQRRRSASRTLHCMLLGWRLSALKVTDKVIFLLGLSLEPST